jgi:predicted HD phosphohydrolase
MGNFPKIEVFERLSDLEEYLNITKSMVCEVEGLSELDHGLQTAYELEIMSPNDKELQLSGLLHDIAHQQCHIRDHEQYGAHMLEKIMPYRVRELIAQHANAKRYLVTVNKSYYDKLTPVSKASFEDQGGLMSDEEVSNFDKHEFRDDLIKVRIADDLAKTPGRIVPDLDYWINDLRALAI